MQNTLFPPMGLATDPTGLFTTVPPSLRQREEHPSPLIRLPSSHVSPLFKIPLPQEPTTEDWVPGVA